MAGKISIIVTSGLREKLQMAAMVAAVGSVSDNQVSVFLSMNALAFFRKSPPSTPRSEGPFGDLLTEKNAPDFKLLFKQAVELGDARLHPCSMAIDLLELSPSDLESYLREPLGLTKFLDDARQAQVFAF